MSDVEISSAAAVADIVGESLRDEVILPSKGTSLLPITLEGVLLPPYREVDGLVLHRNGYGIRQISVYGMKINIYVAGFYSEAPLRTEEEVLSCETPLQFDFTFSRGVGKKQVRYAWQLQLKQSVSYQYEGYEQDRDNFINMFGGLKSGGTESIQLIGEDTLIIDQGELKGRISGKDFQRAFLSMWFGAKPVQLDLKEGLLGHTF